MEQKIRNQLMLQFAATKGKTKKKIEKLPLTKDKTI